MFALFGAQRMVLQAIQDLPKDSAGFVGDSQIAQITHIALNNVRDWVETLEGEGYVEVARTDVGHLATITAKGRLILPRPIQATDNERQPIPSASPAIAVLDSSVLYGASRILGDVHSSSGLSGHNFLDDSDLFQDFLDDLLLYDRLIVHNSTTIKETIRGSDIQHSYDYLLSLLDIINANCGKIVIEDRRIGFSDNFSMQVVMCKIAQLIKSSVRIDDASKISIPWEYSTLSHHDSDDFRKAGNSVGLPTELLPFGLFAFRGIMYTAFANGYSKKASLPVAYIASPGRLSALELVLTSAGIARQEYWRTAYQDLMNELPSLPTDGLDFSLQDSPLEGDLSTLLQIQGEPWEKLETVLRLRGHDSVKKMQVKWGERVFTGPPPLAIGAEEIGPKPARRRPRYRVARPAQ
jgi:hypothetical protein